MPNTTDNGAPVLVIGGGAAGLLAAGSAARRGFAVTVVERNPRMARKVMITGKGRCNVTNKLRRAGIYRSRSFQRTLFIQRLSAFGPQDTRHLLEELGVAAENRAGKPGVPLLGQGGWISSMRW